MPIYFLAIPLALLLVYLPKWATTPLMAKLPGGYDNHHPRDQQATLTGWGRRAAAAHTNGFENFPGFAVGIIVAHLFHMAPGRITLLAAVFCASRALHSLAYIADWALVRSTLWTIGLICTFILLTLPYFI